MSKKFFISFILLLSFFACRKKTSVEVQVYNAALDENVANATVVLVEKKGESGGGIFGGNADCREVASAVTDSDGRCAFDRQKLKSNSKYKYYCAVKESWGVSQIYTCAGKTSGYIDKGNAQKVIIEDDAEGFFRVQYNNLLNPSQPGDSMIVGLVTIPYPNPKGGIVAGGGGVFGSAPHHNIINPPNNPAIVLGPVTKVKGQKLKRIIRKRKMGIVSLMTDTIKVYPGRTTIVEFTW